MKGLAKSIVALALVITVIATMGMSAMAASYTTTTTYVSATEIQVEAKANDLKPGDIVTYVATTDSGDINENTIVYLNQDVVANGADSVTFNYTTNVTNIDAKMLFGGSTESTRVEDDVITEGYRLTVEITGKDPVEVIVPEQGTTADVVRKIELGSSLLAGMNVESLEVNGKTITEGFAADADTIIVKTNEINADGLTLTVNTDVADAVPPSIGSATELTSETEITAYAKAINGDSFGVVIYAENVDVESLNYGSEVVTEKDKYVILPALGKNADGVYGVVLQDYADWITSPAYVKAYAVTTASGVRLSSAAVPLVD